MSGKANPSGLCMCGCGEKTNQVVKKDGIYAKGDSKKYIKNHCMRGKGNRSWNGGRKRHTTGYIQIYKPFHLRTDSNKYEWEHTLVAEKALGKSLPEGAIIHHVNNNRGDNRPENLVICESRVYHHLLHSRTRALEAAGNPDAKKCWICKEWGTDLKLRKDRSSYHRACMREYRKWDESKI